MMDGDMWWLIDWFFSGCEMTGRRDGQQLGWLLIAAIGQAMAAISWGSESSQFNQLGCNSMAHRRVDMGLSMNGVPSKTGRFLINNDHFWLVKGTIIYGQTLIWLAMVQERRKSWQLFLWSRHGWLTSNDHPDLRPGSSQSQNFAQLPPWMKPGW